MGKIDLIDAQTAFRQFRSVGDKSGFAKMKCPKKCKGRIQNKGNCTPENCIMMHKKPVAMAALRIAANKKPRIKKLSKKDRALLRKIKPEFHYRTVFRPKVLKPQLEGNGMKLPRLNPGKVRLPTWAQIFQQYKEVRGEELKEEAKPVWRKLGKEWALKNIGRMEA